MQNEHFLFLREKYPEFIYNDYKIEKSDDEIKITFDFETVGLCQFHPTTRIITKNINLVNDTTSKHFDFLIFCLGVIECISYVKATCSKKITINCGYKLDRETINFFDKIFMNGLGEFFYRNNIDVDDTIFVFEVNGTKTLENEDVNLDLKKCLLPVGGGKDSAVALEMVKQTGDDMYFFTVNDQPARTQTVLAGGFSEDRIIKTYRTIDKNLLELNKQGFLNGHTPFSAIVAFLSSAVSVLCGIYNVVLSNESSANESTVAMQNVNHQYSKSFEFENDFRDVLTHNKIDNINYFSILRPFSEIQITKQFVYYEKYLDVFRSCNLGGKENKWCCNCGKCLFVYCMLSSFLCPERVKKIFGENLLEKESLVTEFDGLVGFIGVKPFECVGTISEVRYALSVACEKYYNTDDKKPFFIQRFIERGNLDEYKKALDMSKFNEETNVKNEFIYPVEQMKRNVTGKV